MANYEPYIYDGRDDAAFILTHIMQRRNHTLELRLALAEKLEQIVTAELHRKKNTRAN